MSNTIERSPRTVVIGDNIIQAAKLAKRLPFARKPADLSQVHGQEYAEVYVTEIKELTTDEFDDFAGNLLVSRDWLRGKGGAGSAATSASRSSHPVALPSMSIRRVATTHGMWPASTRCG